MRVLVTRPADSAERTMRRLAACGHEGLVAPVLVIAETRNPLPAGPFDALLLSSAQAVPAAAQGGARLKALPLFAVGRQSAAAARQAGFADVRIGTGDAAALCDLVRLTEPLPARLLYLGGQERKPDIEQRLSAVGYDLVVHEAYAAEPAPAWPEAVCRAIETGSVDACLHFSRRSAGLAMALAEGVGLSAGFLALRHCCISADSAAPLAAAAVRLGLCAPQCHVAEQPDEACLIDLLPKPEAAAR